MTLAHRLLARLRRADGFTMIELVIVVGMMVTIVTSMTALFVSAARAQIDMNRRVEAQQQARLAVDKLRREVHCSSGVTVTSAASITVTLPAHCPTSGGSIASIAYTTQAVSGSSNRYRLRRGSVTVADYLTGPDVFSYLAPSDDSLGRLHVDASVNVNPNEGWKTWRLQTDIVLRNTLRDPP